MSETATQIVTLTPEAEKMALHFLAEEPAGRVLRVGVTSGGCSGFSYVVSIDDARDDDVVQEQGGFKAVIDPVSVDFLRGATLHYEDSVGHAGFTFQNPNAKSGCGCGKSFDA
ncbi:MAG: HesB/IscA family protein [Planctomycetota bacterium]